MELPPGGTEYMANLSRTLFRGEQFQGIRYFNSIVTGPGVDDAYDPDFEFRPTLVAGYWPGGFLGGGSYAAAVIGEMPTSNLALGEERLFLRELITHSSIGAAALERYRHSVDSSPPDVRLLLQNLGSLAVPAMLEICRERDAPFSCLITGPVVRSNVMAAGERVASLYYPGGIPPRSALANLRLVVKRMELEETL